jgi:hypothetical protein
MAREHARILTRIWDPESDFRNRSADAQRLYFLLLSQRSLNHAGVLPLTVKKWANCCAGTTADDIWSALKELAEERYVVVDADTEEVLVRSYIRNDGVAKQPNILKAALRLASEVESPKLRAVLAGELRRLHLEHADRVADAISGTLPKTPSEPIPKDSPNPKSTVDNPVDNPVDKNPSGTPPEVIGEPFDQNAGIGERGVVISSSVVDHFGGSRVGAHARDAPRAAQQPPRKPRCPKHAALPDDDPGPNCLACRDARLAAERQSTDSHRDRTTTIRACPFCDGEGSRREPGRRTLITPKIRCNHQREQVTTDVP